jgi:predicted Zn-dependent protease
MIKKWTLYFLTSAALVTAGCKKDGGGLNIFTLEDEKTLGLQTKAEIEKDPTQFPILSRSAYPQVYAYLDAMRDDILNSGKVTYKNEFAWEMHIVQRDDVLNAFCTPGGYIYVYTGLIKYLDSKSSLAGVLGHEIAHADKRHSTKQMTKAYGMQTLLDVVLGNNQGLVTQITSELINLKFSRSDESEADKFSVSYLCPTKYKASGAADFFEKISEEEGSRVPAFLSTHPNPDNRVANINAEAASQGCSTTISQTEDVDGYQSFKNMLP